MGYAIDLMSNQELDKLMAEDFKDCLEVIGKYPMSRERAIFLWEKTKQVSWTENLGVFFVLNLFELVR